MNRTAVSSSKFTCDNGIGLKMVYDGADCSGEGYGESDNIITVVCDGQACDYVVIRAYDDSEPFDGSGCSDNYEETAMFIERCIDFNYSSLGADSYSAKAFCDASSGAIDYYADTGCSGGITSSSKDSEVGCVSLIECGDVEDDDVDNDDDGNEDDPADNGSSASLPAALLALAVSAIALIA